ncbi:MAG: LptF/LptG family permease [Bacteroidota bacterium]
MFKNIFRLKILDLYIIRKFLGTFFYAITLILIIVIIFDISEKVDDFIEKAAPVKAIIFDYYLNFIPYFVNLFSALFTFISVIFFTSKMAGNTEIVAILSSGLSFNRLLRPYLIAAMVIALMSFMLTNFVIPQTNKNLMLFESRYIKNVNKNSEVDIHMQISPGTFIYLENFNPYRRTGYRFTLEKINETGLFYKMTSDEIVWDSLRQRWTIEKYFLRRIDGMKERISRGEKIDTVLGFRPEELHISVENAKTMGFWELRKFINSEKMKGAENVIEFEIEKNRRIASPFATIVLTFIGVALSSRKIRGGIGMHLGFGITISFAFILFMQISNTFAVNGNLSPFLAVWFPIVLFGLLGVYLVRIAPK